jgi:hypothetical protein
LDKHLTKVVTDLTDSGFKINLKKSTLQPSQLITHLGLNLNFQEGKLQVPPQRVKGIRKELGKIVKKDSMSKRQLAAILGQIRCNLLALPFLRAFTDTLCQFLVNQAAAPRDSEHFISQDIKNELKEVKILLETWSGRPFPPKCNQGVTFRLQHPCLGGAGRKNWTICPRILENPECVCT